MSRHRSYPDQENPAVDTGRASSQDQSAGPAAEAKIDAKRFGRVRGFFLKATLHILWWDIILNRSGLRRFRTPPLPRWQRLARQYRALALEMGGVLIKLGQFLSTRIDVLPREITDELAELQDQVPPAPLDEVIAQIEDDFERPISNIFAWFSPQAAGAASLAQAHQARLHSGDAVIVKVLRPGIRVLVETDLSAIAQVIGRLKYYRPIRKYVDLDRLANEFTTVTRKELDFEAEGTNAECFSQDFADDPQVCVPKIFWDFTAPHTLTMEDLSSIQIDDLQAIEAAGINRSEVAAKLFNIYMEQFYVTHLVHADPHAGNLFVKPLSSEEEPTVNELPWPGFDPKNSASHSSHQPFQIAFVDFGMVVEIPDRLRTALRQYAIGVGTRDAQRIVKSYVDGGMLQPGVDLRLLEEITQATLDRYWGTMLGQFKDVDVSEYNTFLLQQYREVDMGVPFQIQADLLFVYRAMGILSGMVANLDPEFDPWAETLPFAQRLMNDELEDSWPAPLREVVNFGQLIIRLPKQIEDVLSHPPKTALAPEAQRTLQQLRRAINRQAWVTAAAGLLIAGVLWNFGNRIVAALAQAEPPAHDVGLWLIGFAIVCFLWGLFKKK